MFYTRLQVVCPADFAEILMAEVAEAGFDTFMETEKGFEAYVESERFDRATLASIQQRYEHLQPLLFFYDRIEKQNWNEQWEKSLSPIVVDDRCLVRTDFHQVEKRYPYEIIITPKMSFGTGHHQTTHLMLKQQMDLDHHGKRVMDAGCGTAILSIMATLRGATEVEAFDIDEWSVLNGHENLEINRVQNVRIRQGTIRELDFVGGFDVVLANINKNILLDEMPEYARHLNSGGQLLLSGFYTHDIADLVKRAATVGLQEVSRDERETWATLLLKRD
jgi:ribosomal protein L11 methyltransferase